jgi:hypothetical protein
MEALRITYERFFADYDRVPVLPIDTNEINIVHNPQDLAQVVGRIKSALEKGIYQRPLPRMDDGKRKMKDCLTNRPPDQRRMQG